ncbi:MAG: lysylphosphatidylglycerol synthase transmembrane domain-containing protein [Planctomycetaceae bacterium]|nr:flippase-like domain-containing protein [Planctomycetaceae bacterium]
MNLIGINDIPVDPVPAQSRWRKVGNILLHCVGLVVFVWLVWRCDWRAMLRSWQTLRGDLFALGCLLFPVMMIFKTWRFQALTQRTVGRISLGRAWIVYLAAYFVGIITPGRLGEFARVRYLVKSHQVTVARAFRPVLIDRMFDVLCLVAVGLLGWAALGLRGIEGMTTTRVALLGIVAIVLLTGPLWGSPAIRALGQWAPSRSKFSKLMAWLEETLSIFYTPLGGLCAAMTLLAYLVGFLQAWLIVKAMGINNIAYPDMCVLMASICLAMLLPVSVSGFGTREGAAVLLMGQVYGIAAEQAIAFSLLYFVMSNVIGGLSGGVCYLFMPLCRPAEDMSPTRLKGESQDIL